MSQRSRPRERSRLKERSRLTRRGEVEANEERRGQGQ